MKTQDAGHKETRTVLPEPLSSMGLWNAGNFALPSVTLSAASAAVFAIVFAFLRLGRERELFVLPPPATFAIGVAAALLAWTIALRCRRRPGRIGPRLWALGLACANTAIAVVGYFVRDQAWSLALAVAGFAATITLAPRLLKLRPDSAMVQHVAPLTLVMILLVILPSSCAVRHVIARETGQRVDQRIRQFRLWKTELGELQGLDWRRIEDNPERASHAIEKLKELDFGRTRSDEELWRSAALLGKDSELSAAMQELVAQVVSGFAPPRVPRVSDLHEAAVRWDAQRRRWESYSQFGTLSAITGAYHQELARLFGELRDIPASETQLVEYRRHYDGQRQLLKADLREIASSFSDHWAVFRIADHAAFIDREKETLPDLLRTPFAGSEGNTLTAGNLARLASLPLYEVRRSAGAPGCHFQNFREQSVEYSRLDCYAYTPRSEGSGADLRVEMRLVYASAPGRELHSQSLPSEVFFHFLIPNGANDEQFREEVMTALATSTREAGDEVRSLDRSGSAAGGFEIRSAWNSARVYRPVVVSLTGLDPEPRALQVRVVRPRQEGSHGRRAV